MRGIARLMAIGVVGLAALTAAAQHETPRPTGGDPHATAAAPAGHAEAGGHGDANKPALLQFDPSAALWSIIVFLLLLVLLRLTAWKPMLRVLTEREQFIAKSIADARHEREEAARLLAEHQAQLDRAREEASAIVAEGRRDAEVVARRIQDEARAAADELIARARREIQLAVDTTRKDLQDRAAEVAVAVAGRIIRKELSAAEHRQFVAESLDQIRQAGGPARN